MQLERAVAIPAPRTSRPSGSSTNMNRGSNRIFSRPPRMMPVPASLERPMLRIRLDSTLERTVGIPPKTITHRAYCLAKRYVFSPAPKIPRSSFINRPVPTENAAATSRARPMENRLTRLASSSIPLPSSLEIRAPPPMPASPARHRVMLNTGRIRDVEATI